jgi:hypothetical protein
MKNFIRAQILKIGSEYDKWVMDREGSRPELGPRGNLTSQNVSLDYLIMVEVIIQYEIE